MADTTMTKLEYWDPRTDDWYVAHKGVPLLRPEGYCQRLAQTGKVARVTLLETGEVIQILPTPEPKPVCPLCEEKHPAPYDGTCLL